MRARILAADAAVPSPLLMLALASSWHAVGLMPTLRALARTDTVGANRYFLISLGANRYFPYLRSVQGVQGPFKKNTSIRFLVSETSRLSQPLSRPNYVGGVIISPPGGCILYGGLWFRWCRAIFALC